MKQSAEELLKEIAGADLHFLNQVATNIGGLTDAYGMYGATKTVNEAYYARLHELGDKIREYLTS
jgi:hypothetical protein